MGEPFIKRDGKKLRIGALIIVADRWPWQGYGWFPHKNGKGPTAPLNGSGARFGGGWRYELGIQVGGSTVLANLLFGTLRFTIETAKNRREAEESKAKRQAEIDRILARHPA